MLTTIRHLAACGAFFGLAACGSSGGGSSLPEETTADVELASTLDGNWTVVATVQTTNCGFEAPGDEVRLFLVAASRPGTADVTLDESLGAYEGTIRSGILRASRTNSVGTIDIAATVAADGWTGTVTARYPDGCSSTYSIVAERGTVLPPPSMADVAAAMTGSWLMELDVCEAEPVRFLWLVSSAPGEAAVFIEDEVGSLGFAPLLNGIVSLGGFDFRLENDRLVGFVSNPSDPNCTSQAIVGTRLGEDCPNVDGTQWRVRGSIFGGGTLFDILGTMRQLGCGIRWHVDGSPADFGLIGGADGRDWFAIPTRDASWQIETGMVLTDLEITFSSTTDPFSFSGSAVDVTTGETIDLTGLRF